MFGGVYRHTHGHQKRLFDKTAFFCYHNKNKCSFCEGVITAQYISQTNKYIPPAHYDQIRRNLSTSDRYLCDLLRLTGYRVDDILTSLNCQWDEDPDKVIVVELKTKKTRNVQKTPALIALVDGYRQSIGLSNVHMFDYLCPSLRGGKFSGSHYNRSTLYRHFQRACKDTGLTAHGYTIHSLRKCFAVDYYQHTRSILAVQSALNHDRFTTTLLYLMDCLNISL